MKIRNGFVSNSSSSSFILMFREIPTDIDELKSLMFDDSDEFVYDDNYDNTYSKRQICESVLSDMESTNYNSNNIIELIEEEVGKFNEYNIREWEKIVSPYYSSEYNDIKDKIIECENESNRLMPTYTQRREMGEDLWRIKWNNIYNIKRREMEIQSDRMYNLLEKVFREHYNDCKFNTVEYSDNDGSYGSFMEHSGVLDRISLVKISHH